MDERFIPSAKKQRVEQVQTIRGLHPDVLHALNHYRPNPNREPRSCASSVSESQSDGSWEQVGGRVEGTNNILLNWGNEPGVAGSERDEFPVHGDADDSAQKVIERNIEDFLRMQMNRYVLNNRDFLDLDDGDIDRVQRNIIKYWLDRHQKIERDPLYNFCELVAGALDEKVEYLLADARDFRQVYEGRTATGREFRFAETKETSGTEFLDGKQTKKSGQKTVTPGIQEGRREDSFITEQQNLLKKSQMVRNTLEKYAQERLDGRKAHIDAATFMLMLRDFEISGHIEVKPVLTNSWKAVHRTILKMAFPRGVTDPTFFSLIPNSNIRAAYARATALQMMLYRQLDKRRSYLAVDYDRIKEQLEEAHRDIIDVLRNELVLGERDPALEALAKGIASSSGRTLEMVTDVSGKLLPQIQYEVENTFAQIKIKRGIDQRLTLDTLIRTPILSNLFGKLVGMQLRLQLDPKHQGRLTIEMQQREGEVNSMWTEVYTVLRRAGFLKLPVNRYGMTCASFA